MNPDSSAHSPEPQQHLVSLEAEQSICGALLQDESRLDDVIELVTADDFFYNRYRQIFSAITDLRNDNQAVDVITVAERFGDDDSFDLVTDLATNVPSSANAVAYARIVRDRSIKRGVCHALSSSLTAVHGSPELSAAQVVELAQSAVMGLSDSQTDALDVTHIDDAIKGVIAQLEKQLEGEELPGISTGLKALDEKVFKYQPGDLVLMAARPSIGKTTVALQQATGMWTTGLNGIFFSLEMTAKKLTQKSICCLGKIPLRLFKNPSYDELARYQSQMQAAVARLKGVGCNIVNCPGIHINQLKSFARKAHKRRKLDFLMVDHVNIMDADGGNDTARVTQITKGLKHIAMELGIPVIALMQLNRGVESRTNKRPIMSDLRESGSAEQDADIILLLYRDDYYKANPDISHPNDGLFEINVAKQRDGETGTIYFEHILGQSRIEDTNRLPEFEIKPSKSYRRPE